MRHQDVPAGIMRSRRPVRHRESTVEFAAFVAVFVIPNETL
jgi:hypothetical protein